MKTRLSEAIQDYDYFRLSDGRGAGTREGEQITLRRLLEQVGDIQLSSLDERHLTEYLAQRARNCEASTVRLDMSRLNMFFKWARSTKRMPRDHDPLAGRRGPRVVLKERRRVHVSKFPHLLEVANERSPRDRILVALGLFSLLRDQEMLSIRLRDVDLDAGTMFVRVHKSADEDQLGISPALDAELRRWFKEYQDMCGALQPDWYLIPSRKTRMLKGTNLINGGVVEYTPTRPLYRSHSVVGPVLEAAGFPVRDENGKPYREGAHTLRRSGARAFYDLLVERGNVDALDITRVTLHHKDVKQTQHYIGLRESRETRNDLLHEVRYPFEATNVVRMEKADGASTRSSDVV